MNPAFLVAALLASVLWYARSHAQAQQSAAVASGTGDAAQLAGAGASGQGSPGLDFLGTGPLSGLISGAFPPPTASAGYSTAGGAGAALYGYSSGDAAAGSYSGYSGGGAYSTSTGGGGGGGGVPPSVQNAQFLGSYNPGPGSFGTGTIAYGGGGGSALGVASLPHGAPQYQPGSIVGAGAPQAA